MLKLDLARLEREGTLGVDAAIPADDPLWEGSRLTLAAPLEVRLQAHHAESGEVVVRGTLKGALAAECRRCLDAVEVPVDEEITMVFSPRDALSFEEDAELRELPLDALELELAEPIREELILSTPKFVECDPDCRGLCPRCGADLNEETCDCTTEERDPRWDALRAIKDE